MLTYFQRRGKGRDPRSQLTLTATVPLPLSADTMGWLQQDSTEEYSQSSSRSSNLIPFPEQDDPPDSYADWLP